MRIDVGHVGRQNAARVENDFAGVAVGHGDAVHLEQTAHHLNIADGGNVTQGAGGVAENGGHHGLGHQVLGALNIDAPGEGAATANNDGLGFETYLGARGACVVRYRVHACLAGRVLGIHAGREASKSVMACSSRRVRPISSRPSMSRQRV